jgi:hypothetical protein
VAGGSQPEHATRRPAPIAPRRAPASGPELAVQGRDLNRTTGETTQRTREPIVDIGPSPNKRTRAPCELDPDPPVRVDLSAPRIPTA